MKNKTITILIACLALLLFSGCEGATSGSVISSSQSCHNLGGYGDCEGRIGRLSGSYSIDVEDEGISPGDEIVVELTISVEEGSLVVTLPGVDGADTTIEVGSGETASGTGILGGDFDGFEFNLRAPGDPVSGIGYSLRYFIQ